MKISVNMAECVSKQMAILQEQFSDIITDLHLQDVEFSLGSSSGDIFNPSITMQDVVDAPRKRYRLYLYFGTGVDRPSYAHHLRSGGRSRTTTACRDSPRHHPLTDNGYQLIADGQS